MHDHGCHENAAARVPISLLVDIGYFCSAVSSLSEHLHSSLPVRRLSVCVPPKSRAERLASQAGALRGGLWDVIRS